MFSTSNIFVALAEKIHSQLSVCPFSLLDLPLHFTSEHWGVLWFSDDLRCERKTLSLSFFSLHLSSKMAVTRSLVSSCVDISVHQEEREESRAPSLLSFPHPLFSSSMPRLFFPQFLFPCFCFSSTSSALSLFLSAHFFHMLPVLVPAPGDISLFKKRK